MKKIYTFTLDDSEVLSERSKNDLRLMAYLVYDQLVAYEMRENKNLLVRGKYIKENELYERMENGIYHYRFASDEIYMENYFFEPFLINDYSFGMTVYDGVISNMEIEMILDSVISLIHFDKEIYIDSIVYDSINENDEDNRIDAIKRISNKINYVYVDKDESKIKKKSKYNPMMMLLRTFGR